MRRWPNALTALAAIAVTCLFFINYCDLIFQCGCTFLWSGADAHCNVHHGPKRCPICAGGPASQYGIWVAMVIPQVFVSFRKARWNPATRLILAVLVAPVAGVVPAITLGFWQGYWN